MSEAERAGLRVIQGGNDAGPSASSRSRLLLVSSVGLMAGSVTLEYVRATRGGAASDLALALVIACSIGVIAGALKRYDAALKVWLAAAAVHVAAALAAFVYFHLVLFADHPVPLTRGQLMLLQVKALVGFVLMVGLVCMIASAVRKAVRGAP